MRIEKRVYEVLPTGKYDAVVASISEKSGVFGAQLEWRFTLDDSDTSLLGWTSATLSEKSKLYRWASAILGYPADGLETDDLLGMACRLSVIEKARDDGSTCNKIESVLPAGKIKIKPAPIAAVDEIAEVVPF